MADVSSNFYDWSTTAASNGPLGSTTIGTGLDDNLREIQAVTRAGLASVGANIASATTTDLGAVPGLRHLITGTTTITSFGTVSAGLWKILVFQGALTLTHNATSLILPSGANITTAAGDVAIMQSEGSGNWRCINYARANGRAIGVAPINRVFGSYTANADLTANIPVDDTIPQNTEGTQIISVSITPSSATAVLRCQFQALGTTSVSSQVVVCALFTSASSSAISSSATSISATGLLQPVALQHEFVPGSTSPLTITVRVGAGSGDVRLNGNLSGRFFGGTAAATLVVEEVAS